MSLADSVAPPTAAPSPKRRAWIWLGSVAALFAIAGVALGIFVLATSVAPKAEWTAPGTAAVSLEPGTYTVWQKTGSSMSIGPLTTSTNGPRSVKSEDISILSSSGPVEVEKAYGNSTSETLSWAGSNYTGIARFDVTSTDDYAITVSGNDADQFAASSSTLEVLKKMLPALLLGLIAFLLAAFTGLREFFAYRGREVMKAPQRFGTQCGYWALDPYGVAQYRWFDGENWTAHTANGIGVGH